MAGELLEEIFAQIDAKWRQPAMIPVTIRGVPSYTDVMARFGSFVGGPLRSFARSDETVDMAAAVVSLCYIAPGDITITISRLRPGVYGLRAEFGQPFIPDMEAAAKLLTRITGVDVSPATIAPREFPQHPTVWIGGEGRTAAFCVAAAASGEEILVCTDADPAREAQWVVLKVRSDFPSGFANTATAIVMSNMRRPGRVTLAVGSEGALLNMPDGPLEERWDYAQRLLFGWHAPAETMVRAFDGQFPVTAAMLRTYRGTRECGRLHVFTYDGGLLDDGEFDLVSRLPWSEIDIEVLPSTWTDVAACGLVGQLRRGCPSVALIVESDGRSRTARVAAARALLDEFSAAVPKARRRRRAQLVGEWGALREISEGLASILEDVTAGELWAALVAIPLRAEEEERRRAAARREPSQRTARRSSSQRSHCYRAEAEPARWVLPATETVG